MLITVGDINIVIVLLIAGLLFLTIALFAERKQKQILAFAHDWREDLGSWE